MVNVPTSSQQTNRLIREKSPYLLQHARNPVDWYPWGEEAFRKAAAEDKPIFLSVGYSTCHWCHVMAHESFEDEEVARLLNEAFVAIKVDREERPDIDTLYMTVCQMTTGGGGWPLNVILTPERKPFFAGTYFPKHSRFGRIGIIELIPRIQEIWKNRREEAISSANQLAFELQAATADSPGVSLQVSTLDKAYNELSQRFDERHGGFGNAPKFPTPHHFLFLLRYWKRTGNVQALTLVEKSLQAMRCGGIYDQIGFGFHRYSVDSEWLVPHFEKMLYDQALLTIAYAETFQATGKESYRKVAEEIITYVLRDLTDTEGGFYSSEDADSEGEEGKFYLWTEDEVRASVGEQEADLVFQSFNFQPDGNFHDEATHQLTGKNIPHLTQNLDTVPLEPQEEQMRQKLFATREKRIHPHKDDKILTDWNGLMIAALAKASQAFQEPRYIEVAKRAVHFILNKMVDSHGKLLHRYRDGESGIAGYLNDYTFLMWGLIELYEATFDVTYLKSALQFNQILLEHFWDEENGSFFFVSDEAENVLVRHKEIYDGAIPSGNSVAMYNLLRLSHMTGNVDFAEKGERIAKAFSAQVEKMPIGYTQLLVALDFALGPSHTVFIVGETEQAETKEMLQKIQKVFLPRKVLLFHDDESDSTEMTSIAPFTRDFASLEGKPVAYVCENFACKLPTSNVDEALAFLKAD